MICNNCKNRNICTIFKDIINNLNYIEITIDNCLYFKGEIVVNKENYDVANAFNRGIKGTNIDIIEASKLNTLKNIEGKNRIETNKPKIKTELKAEPLKLDSICPTCKGNTFKEDVAKCDICGVPICSCCATIDSSSGNILCQECWSKF